MHYVVVGAGPAGVIASEALRKTDPDGQITLVGDETEPPYSRMAIPYLLVENIDEAGTYLRKEQDHYNKLGIDVRQDRVTSVDPNQKHLQLAGGGTLEYDKLLIATGSKPMLPPVPGADSPGVHTCWTLDDARHILERAKPGSKVLLIGAGFIGSIILEALAGRDVDLTVVEMGDRMVPRMMNETAGGMIKAWCEHKGVRVLTGTSVTGIEDQGAGVAAPAPSPPPAAAPSSGGGIAGFFSRLFGGGGAVSTPAAQPAAAPVSSGAPLRVTLNSGETLQADLIISAAGVKPNVDLLEGSGVEIDQGVLINHCFQSNFPDIYAAGDAAQGRDFSTGSMEVHAIQPTASEHGRIAALNMAGHETYYPGSFNMNVLDTLGLVSSSFGLWMGADGGEQAELSDPERFRYVNLQFDGDVMIGATTLGLTQHVGVLRGLIQGKTPLGPWKDKLVHDPTRLMEAYLDRTHAYG
jgi:NAD(P)H-nitrite reductase large subunit